MGLECSSCASNQFLDKQDLFCKEICKIKENLYVKHLKHNDNTLDKDIVFNVQSLHLLISVLLKRFLGHPKGKLEQLLLVMFFPEASKQKPKR